LQQPLEKAGEKSAFLTNEQKVSSALTKRQIHRGLASSLSPIVSTSYRRPKGAFKERNTRKQAFGKSLTKNVKPLQEGKDGVHASQ
jgi:hypothetical protein